MVDKLRESRRGATVIFTQFTRLNKYYSDSLFCCFEGDDAKYYFQRIETKTGYPPNRIIAFHCGGKNEVLRLQKMISAKIEYTNVDFLYFIDRDFDLPINIAGIYETPVYSVENFYTTRESFIRILKCEFNYNESDTEYDFIIDMFNIRQQEFHEKTLLLNAWLGCQRDKFEMNSTERLNLNNFSLNDLKFKIDLDKVECDYEISTLEKLFPQSAKISHDELTKKISFFQRLIPQKKFRGKFEIDFLFDFLESIKIEFKKPNSRILKKRGVTLNQSKKNIISEFSGYADTPPCLISYLGSYC